MGTSRYEMSQNQMTNLRPKLLYITKSKYGEDWNLTLHSHPYLELIIVIKGVGLLIARNNQYEIKKGDLVVIEKNSLHTENSNDRDPLEYIAIGVDNISLKSINKSYSTDQINQPLIFSVFVYIDKIMLYINTILNEINAKELYYEIMVENLLSELLILIMRNTNTTAILADSMAIGSQECSFIKNYIDYNFATEISLDELAGKVFLSKYHLSHLFKRCVGTSPIKYVIRKRLEESKMLLKTTNMTITNIARCVGFSSASRFTEKFKIAFLVSPSKYRKDRDIKI